jgi:hypothetical protein
LCAKTHEIRAAGDIAETDDSANGMDWYTETNLSVCLDHNCFTFLGEVPSLER